MQKQGKTRVVLMCFLAFFVLAAGVGDLYSCTTFCLKGGGRIVVGKNYDWMIESGMLVTNMRNMAKTALVEEGERPARWVSKYGSITFNQYGREFPNGGMNEAGLVVEVMVSKVEYPAPDERPTMESLSWVQYQLDNHRTVQEVIASNKQISIRNKSVAPIHFMVCDKEGNTATIDFIGGEFVCHVNDNMPLKVLTNNPYNESVDYFCSVQTGKTKPVPGAGNSLNRFKTASAMIIDYSARPTKPIVDYGFEVSDAVGVGGTQWKIIYDVTNLEINFKTRTKDKIKKVRLSQFDFGGSGPVKIFKLLEGDYSGKIDQYFMPYDSNYNKKLVFENCRNTTRYGVDMFPEEYLEKIAGYPETTRRIRR